MLPQKTIAAWKRLGTGGTSGGFLDIEAASAAGKWPFRQDDIAEEEERGKQEKAEAEAAADAICIIAHKAQSPNKQ